MKYIISIDQSTSATKAVLFDGEMNLVSKSVRPHRQIILPKGWVEHDPEEIYSNTIATVKELLDKTNINKADIACAAITNQRETALVWDRATGKPVYNAIVWHCARAVKECEAVSGYADEIFNKTGLNLSPYYSAAKIRWILNNINLRPKKPACGTMDSWLIFRLTHGGHFKTDYSNASRTQLFNIDTLCWDEKICGLFGIPQEMLAEVCDSNGFFGETDFEGLLDKKIPIRAVLADSSASLLGLGCMGAGQAKCSYGTGSSIMVNMGNKRPGSTKNTATSVAWSIGGKADYAAEGNINYSGAVINWLCDDAKLIDSPEESEALARMADQEDTTYLVPAFSGLGAPYWDTEAKAAFLGMTRRTGRSELVKAALQSIAFQVRDVLACMKKESGVSLQSLCVDGGASKNGYLMQFQSDITGLSLLVSGNPELSAKGAALIAGDSMCLFNMNDITGKTDFKRYTPDMNANTREALLDGWHEAVSAVLKGKFDF